MSAVHNHSVRTAISSTWWIALIQGVVTLIFGFYALTQTGATLATLLGLLGIYWVISGISAVWSALRGTSERSRLWALIGGIITFFAGLFALMHPLMSGVITATVAAAIIGISAIAGGLIQIFVGRQIQSGLGLEWSWSSLFLGILNVIFGLIVISNPMWSVILFVRIIGWWAVIGGILMLVAAFRTRRLAK